ncbi:hypothetical protein Q3O60_08940 [Alkalimonas collagenimarina]|uniref:DUF35 domain-containing protein n=1 Tax=Alkalimonas collagenimarina TaxID=400390 RepID=A0ABT9GZ28_9GAMM|nr:hypothetical protein [Alkalimonas collagenimarina]MDP4536313.1 hypothetical protein [Alkalimonas collagenimarina]
MPLYIENRLRWIREMRHKSPCKRCGTLYNHHIKAKCPDCGTLDSHELRELLAQKDVIVRDLRRMGGVFAVLAVLATLLFFW